MAVPVQIMHSSGGNTLDGVDLSLKGGTTTSVNKAAETVTRHRGPGAVATQALTADGITVQITVQSSNIDLIADEKLQMSGVKELKLKYQKTDKNRPQADENGELFRTASVVVLSIRNIIPVNVNDPVCEIVMEAFTEDGKEESIWKYTLE